MCSQVKVRGVWNRGGSEAGRGKKSSGVWKVEPRHQPDKRVWVREEGRIWPARSSTHDTLRDPALRAPAQGFPTNSCHIKVSKGLRAGSYETPRPGSKMWGPQ